jgi:hypothetical protein
VLQCEVEGGGMGKKQQHQHEPAWEMDNKTLVVKLDTRHVQNIGTALVQLIGPAPPWD